MFSVGLALLTQDEKMLSRLLARREQEQQMSHQRELSHRQWEEERKLVTSLAILKRQTSRPPETPKSIRRDLSQTVLVIFCSSGRSFQFFSGGAKFRPTS